MLKLYQIINQKTHRMKTLLKVYLLFVLIALSCCTTIVKAQTCATVERFQTTTFARLVSGPGANVPIATYSQSGWQGSGSGNIDRGTDNVYFSDNTNTQTFTQAVTNVNLKGTGATFSMSFAAFNGNSISFPYDGNQSDLRISYGGVLYATISTSNGTATTGAGTISFSNGAVNSVDGSAASYTYNLTPNTGGGVVDVFLVVKLPGTIPNSGNFAVSFVSNANTVDPRSFADDFNVYTASLLSCPIVYSGIVLNDANGSSDNLVNGTPINTATVSGLQVALYDGSGNIVPGTTTNLNADGTYDISYIGTGTYTVRLLNKPSTYVNTGESSNGTGTTPDGAADGIVSSYTILNANTNTDKPNGNIGIEQTPIADDKTIINLPNSTFSSTPPSGFPLVAGYSAAQMNNPALQTLSGSDAEDCAATSSCTSGSTFIVESIKTSNTKLYYDFPGIGVQEVVPGTATGTIPGFDPAKMVIYGAIGSGGSGNPFEFTYQLVDAAGVASAPATYSVSSQTPLPVVLTSFVAKKGEGLTAALDWTTTTESNSKEFELQHSIDAKKWNVIGTVDAKGESKKRVIYSYTHTTPVAGENLYRLKMIDLDGTFAYSRIESVSLAMASLFPNPASDKIKVSLQGAVTGDVTKIKLIGLDGTVVYTANKLEDGEIDVINISPGAYILAISLKNGTIRNSKIVVVR